MFVGTNGAFIAVTHSDHTEIINLLETAGFVMRGLSGSMNTLIVHRKLACAHS